jgi:hypothetical protein
MMMFSIEGLDQLGNNIVSKSMYTVSLCNVSFSCKINLIKPHVKITRFWGFFWGGGDNYNVFTSPLLCRNMFDNQTYLTGTVRATRKNMPKSFRNMKLQKGERVVRQSGAIMALMYGTYIYFKTHVQCISKRGQSIVLA